MKPNSPRSGLLLMNSSRARCRNNEASPFVTKLKIKVRRLKPKIIENATKGEYKSQLKIKYYNAKPQKTSKSTNCQGLKGSKEQNLILGPFI